MSLVCRAFAALMFIVAHSGIAAAQMASMSRGVTAVADGGLAITGVPSTVVGNVAANDMVNGVPVTLLSGGNATVSQIGSWPGGFSLNTTTGGVTMDATVLSGTYQMRYQLCETNSPADCATATVTALVTPEFADVRIGCPMFHCTPEATGVMSQPIVTPTVVTGQPALGKLRTQGCSGDGTTLACIFSIDAVPAGSQVSGLLKSIDPVTLQPIWGDAGVPGSYVIDGGGNVGEVPYLFPNGQIGAGDSSGYALYNADGSLDSVIALDSNRGATMGLTPLTADYAVITQASGMLTLIDTNDWVAVATLSLRDPKGASVKLTSPSAASDGVLYAVGNNSAGNGFLFGVDVEPTLGGSIALRNRATYTYTGTTGASPVVVRPSVSGLQNNLILLHVPGLSGDAQNRLLGLSDTGTSFVKTWSIPLAVALQVAPTIDSVSHRLFFALSTLPDIYAADIATGMQDTGPFNIQELGSFPSDFRLNGHIPSVQPGSSGAYTLLLSGLSKATSDSSGGQFVLGFQPSTSHIVWKLRTSATPDANTEAWSLVPSNTPNLYCLTVVGSTSGISRLCDD